MDELYSVFQSFRDQVRANQQASEVAREVVKQQNTVDLDIAVRAHVLANPALYEQAGADIDATYSPEVFWQADLAFYKAQACYPPDNYPTLDQWRSPAKRIGRIVSEMVEHYRAFRGIPPVDRAAKVVLLHWVLTDESCNTARVKLTEFQDWSKAGGADHELMHANAYGYANNTDWREYVRKALAVMQSQAAIADPIQAMLAAFDRFDSILDATTTPNPNGREVGPAPHAITLSQANTELHESIGAAMPTALARDDQSFMAALTSAIQATGWTVDRHNRAQAGGWPHRWEPGEIIPAKLIALIAQARKLLRLNDHPIADALARIEAAAALPAMLESNAKGMERVVAAVSEQNAAKRAGDDSAPTDVKAGNTIAEMKPGKRSAPMSKAELARRMLNRSRAKARDVQWARFDWQQWQNSPILGTISLANCDQRMIDRIEAEHFAPILNQTKPK